MPTKNSEFSAGTPSLMAKISIIGVDKTSVTHVNTEGLTPLSNLLLRITVKADNTDVSNAV